MLNDLDRRILRFLQSDPTAPLSELAERCQSQPATVTRRLDRLKREGVLRGVHAVIDWAVLGYGVEVSLRFTLDKTNSKAFDEFLEEFQPSYANYLVDVYAPPEPFGAPKVLPTTIILNPEGYSVKAFLGPVVRKDIESFIDAE